MAFQIRDDILDGEGRVRTMMKNAHKDGGKSTSVDVYGSEGARRRMRTLLDEGIRAINGIPNNHGLRSLAERLRL